MPAVTTPLWNEPKQKRSRARVNDIVAEAKRLIGKRGLDGFTMQDVSDGAGVAAGTLYQFFPDRNALIAKLFQETLDAADNAIEHHYEDVSTQEEFESALGELIQTLYEVARQEPAYVEIWNALQALPAIRRLDEENSRKNAVVLFKMARPWVRPSISDQRLQLSCYMMCELMTTLIQLALRHPPEESKILVAEFTAMARAYLHFPTEV